MAAELVKTGYLTKSPPQSNTSISFKNWRRRWFVLVDSSKAFPLAPRQVRLEYYTDETSASHCDKPKGVIDLRDCSGVVSSVKEIRGHKNIFNVVTKRRCYHLSADTVTEKDKWVYELQRIVNDCKSPQHFGLATGQYSSGSSDDDATLAVPKLITPGSSSKKLRKSKSVDVTGSSPSQSGFSGSPLTSYDEEWDSDDETAGPMSVSSSTHLGVEDVAQAPGRKSAPTHTFGRNASPRFSGIVAEPLRFGSAGDFSGESDDGVPDYANMPDDTSDGIHDYYDYGLDETEDGINDYDDTADEVEHRYGDYANLDSGGNHVKDTDDGIFDYADVEMAPVKPRASQRHRADRSSGSIGSRTGRPGKPATPYVNLDSLDLMSTGGSDGVRGSSAASSSSSTSLRPQSTPDGDLLLSMPLPISSIKRFGSEESTPENPWSGAHVGTGRPTAPRQANHGPNGHPHPVHRPRPPPAATKPPATARKPSLEDRQRSAPAVLGSSGGRPKPPPPAYKPRNSAYQ